MDLMPTARIMDIPRFTIVSTSNHEATRRTRAAASREAVPRTVRPFGVEIAPSDTQG
jgi:hypothetical protein